MKNFILFWALGGVIYFLISKNHLNSLTGFSASLLFCLTVVGLSNFSSDQRVRQLLAYGLFFTITLTSILGLTEVMTGARVEATQPIFFGLSFYSLSLAYLVFHKPQLTHVDAFKSANPLLLYTGPVAVFVRDIRYKQLKSRFIYFFPFIVVGVFFYQIIGAPLTLSFNLINSTDLVSALLFAIIFEIFVYANFCGLSLILYGVFGVCGFKIPLNFRQPFSSRNVVEFWRGWHISLSIVLKSLFYSPLRQKFPSIIAVFGVFLASAVWHGISFNYLIWGVFHASVFYLTVKLLKRRVKYFPLILLFIAIPLARMLSSDPDTDRLLEKLMFDFDGFEAIEKLRGFYFVTHLAIILGLGLIAIEFFFKDMRIVAKRNYKYLRTPFAQLSLISLFILFASNTGVDFAVYGQR